MFPWPCSRPHYSPSPWEVVWPWDRATVSLLLTFYTLHSPVPIFLRSLFNCLLCFLTAFPKWVSGGISTISLRSTFLPLSEYCCVSPMQSVTPYMKSLAGCDADKTVASGEEWLKQATYGSQAGHLKARRKTSGIHFCRALCGTWLLNVYCWHVVAVALV